MKTFSFWVGGSWGKGDSWDGTIDYELSDEDAVRLAEAAKGKSYWEFQEDESVRDIYEKVYNAAYEFEIKSIMSDREQMDDLRWDYLQDDEHYEDPEYCKEIEAWIKKAIPFTDRELAEESFTSSLDVGYPEELLGK